MTSGVRASAPVEGGRGSDRPALPSAGLPDLHTTERLAWLEAVQSDEARRSMWLTPAILACVMCWLALLTWWAW